MDRSSGSRLVSCAVLVLLAPLTGLGQTPLDIFADSPRLADGFIRVGAWNLRHINLESGAATFLPGQTREDDFTILIGTFAKAIQDLDLHLVAVEEVQPRQGEPNRLNQLRDRLNANVGAAAPWRSDQSEIEYDTTTGGLQLGLLWDHRRVQIDPATDMLLPNLRQPRNPNGTLADNTLRAPWLVPVTAGHLVFDLLILHLKTAGAVPQQAEVDALEGFITTRQSASTPRHLVVVGDWNIRPDTTQGRRRLHQMQAPTTAGNLMNVLTCEQIRPTIEEWETIDDIGSLGVTLPFTHYTTTATGTFLDHVAISRTLDEIFDNPIQVTLSGSNTTDLLPGIAIAVPLIPKDQYLHLTDHLPVILTLRTTAPGDEPASTPALRIVAALPNPTGDDREFEEVRLRNDTTAPVPLAGWRISDVDGESSWNLTAADGIVAPGATVIVVRKGRPMSLNNSGDTIVVFNTSNQHIDAKSYDNAPSGKLFQWN